MGRRASRLAPGKRGSSMLIMRRMVVDRKEKVPIWWGSAACDGSVGWEPIRRARRRNMHVDMQEGYASSRLRSWECSLWCVEQVQAHDKTRQPALVCYLRCKVGAKRASELWARGTFVVLYGSCDRSWLPLVLHEIPSVGDLESHQG
jgi:hypothetical protein